jgi:hypothetical protein
MNVASMWSKLVEIFHTAVRKFVPLARANSRKHPPWMTYAVKKLRKYKINMWRKYRLSGSYNDHEE